jgi:hypothetical protein
MEKPTVISHLRMRAVIARSVGILAIALGFVSGMYGLEHTETIWLRTALGLLVTVCHVLLDQTGS